MAKGSARLLFSILLAIILLPQYFGGAEASRAELTPLVEGDLNVVAMLRMHSVDAKSNPSCRRVLTSSGIQLASGLYYAVERTNANLEILPALRLGLTIVDLSCDNSPSSMREALAYITGPRSKGLGWSFLPVLNGLAADDPVHLTVTHTLDALDIPQLFLESESSRASRGMSVLPPRTSMAHALFDVIRAYEVHEFVVLLEENSENVWHGVLDELRTNIDSYVGIAKPDHMCLRDVVYLQAGDSQRLGSQVRRFVSSLLDEGQSQTTVILLCSEATVKEVFTEARARNISNRVWLSQHIADELLAVDHFQAQDIIMMQDLNHQARPVADFLSFLSTAAQRSVAKSQSDWIGEFVRQQRHWCIWAQNFTSEQMEMCKKIVSNPPEFQQHMLASPAIDSVGIVASAIESLRKLYCSLAPSPLVRKQCPLKNFKPSAVLFKDAVRNATSLTTFNETMAYQEAFNSFQMPHFRIGRKRAGAATVQLITDWQVQSIKDNTIRRNINQADVHAFRTLCKPQCTAGTFKSPVEHSGQALGMGHGQCAASCSTCRSCSDGTYSQEENSEECSPCPVGYVVSQDLTGCIEQTLDVLKWSDSAAIALLLLSGLGGLAVLVLAMVLLRMHLYGELNDQVLLLLTGAVLVVGVLVPFHVLFPSAATCSVRFVLRHAPFVVFSAALVLFAKSRAGKEMEDDDGSLSIPDYAVMGGVSTGCLLVSLVSLVASPAVVSLVDVTGTHQQITCLYNTAVMSVMLAVGAVACTAAFLFSWLVWRRSGTALLALTCLVCLVSWLAFNLVRHSSVGARNQILDGCQHVVVLYATLLLVLVPGMVAANQESELSAASDPRRPRKRERVMKPQTRPGRNAKNTSLRLQSSQSQDAARLSQYENNGSLNQPGYMLAGYPNTKSGRPSDYGCFQGVAGRHVEFTLDEEVASINEDGNAPDRPPTPPEFACPPAIYSNPPMPMPRHLAQRRSKPPPPSDPPPDCEYA